jgi:hypothetical protein
MGKIPPTKKDMNITIAPFRRLPRISRFRLSSSVIIVFNQTIIGCNLIYNHLQFLIGKPFGLVDFFYLYSFLIRSISISYSSLLISDCKISIWDLTAR